jgi:hypothetical protein
MDRYQAFLMLVQMACLHYDIKGVCDNPLWPLADALCLEPGCIPPNVELAAWQFVDRLVSGKPRPEWVQHRPDAENPAMQPAGEG